MVLATAVLLCALTMWQWCGHVYYDAATGHLLHIFYYLFFGFVGLGIGPLGPGRNFLQSPGIDGPRSLTGIQK